MSKYQIARNIGNTAALAMCLLVISNPSSAGGFALNDQSATFLGNAYAGTSSAIQDASTGYYNPAGLSELRYSQVVISGTYLYKHIKLYDGVATNSLGDPISGNNPTKPSSNMVIPAGHIAWRVNNKFSLGLSVVEPFGLDIRYSNTDIARLMATKDKITTVDISPTFGYKFNRYFSVGAGLDFLKTNTTISSDVAWASIGPEANGFVINSANSWSLGYHVGILLKPWCNTSMGLVYFSRFNPKFTGTTQSDQTLDFDNPNSVSYALNLPDRINYSVMQNFSNKFAAMAEVEWTHWSRLKQLTMNYNSSALPGVQSFYFNNTWRASIGADYKATSKLVLKGGAAFDQSPATSIYRSAMIPDSNRYLLAIGAKFFFNQRLSMNIGYAHAFYINSTIAETGLNNALNPSPSLVNLSTLNAKVKSSADIFGLQLSLNLFKNKEQKTVKKANKNSKIKNKSISSKKTK